MIRADLTLVLFDRTWGCPREASEPLDRPTAPLGSPDLDATLGRIEVEPRRVGA